MTETREMLILSGLPASGKTTVAKEWLAEDPTNRERVNYDNLRIELFGEGWKFNRPEEDKMQAYARGLVEGWLIHGKSVVIDNTNLTEKVRERWAALGRKYGVNIVQQEIDTPVAECVRRDSERIGRARVGRAVIERMALLHGFIDWADYPRDFVIFDMDGTLADCEHRRHHVKVPECTCQTLTKEQSTTEHCAKETFKKNWPAFFKDCREDPPVKMIVMLAQILQKHFDILIVSGRPINLCGQATEAWLEEHLGVPYLHLFMAPGDHHSDVEVKQEILDHLPKDRIAYVIDDRPAVLRMWRENGLTTLAVGSREEF